MQSMTNKNNVSVKIVQVIGMKINMVENSTVNDFVLVEDTNRYRQGHLLFYKFTVKNNPYVVIFLQENSILKDYTTILFDYLIWLGTKGGDVFIKFYNERMENCRKVDFNWYIKLECEYIEITIDENGKINSSIHCKSGQDDLDIRITEKEIISMGYRKDN